MVDVLGVGYSDTVGLGSIVVGGLVAFGAVVSIVRGVRWRVAAEVSSAAADELRKALADEKQISTDREERLHNELKEARALHESRLDELRIAQATIAKLEALPDLARVVSLLDSHEVRAQERHESVVSVLQALTDRITSSTQGVTS